MGGHEDRQRVSQCRPLARALAIQASGPAVQVAIHSAEGEDDSGSPGSPGSSTMRREVHRATGMILKQLETTGTHAFSLLRAHAFVSGRTVEQAAQDVVGRVLDFRHLSD